ncbi:hypothetical protein AC249_AIPGENE9670 [Exaiptasia diaphana]|nr:hypothetical protein AC249_AIPGENE9670 [Exaiptasia diaphana]
MNNLRFTLFFGLVMLLVLDNPTESMVAGISSGVTKKRTAYANCEGMRSFVCQMAMKVGCYNNHKREGTFQED